LFLPGQLQWSFGVATDYRRIVESQFLNGLALVALVLLVVVTGGIGYLTLADWRDRRLRDQEKRETRRTTPKRR
jgi:hypothetical protein